MAAFHKNTGLKIRQKRSSSCRTDPETCVIGEVFERSVHFEGGRQLALVGCLKHGTNSWKWIEREKEEAASSSSRPPTSRAYAGGDQ